MKSRQQNICDLVEKLVGVVSAVSVLLSLLRFSPFSKFVVPVCYVCDILFFALLFFRLKFYGAVEYLCTWQNLVDLLAALPVLVLFSRHSSLFQFITPLNCFCLFRLLNIIQIAKHSALAKKHFQHICFIVIMIETATILGANVLFRSFFNAPLIAKYTAEYERFPSNPEYLMKDDENVILVYKNGTIQNRRGFIRDKKAHFSICNSPCDYLIRINFSKEKINSDGGIIAPKCGIIVSSPELQLTFNCFMLIMFLLSLATFFIILCCDKLTEDGRKIAVAADSLKTGDYSKFNEINGKIEHGSKDEIYHLYKEINNIRQFISRTSEKADEILSEDEAEINSLLPLDAERQADKSYENKSDLMFLESAESEITKNAGHDENKRLYGDMADEKAVQKPVSEKSADLEMLELLMPEESELEKCMKADELEAINEVKTSSAYFQENDEVNREQQELKAEKRSESAFCNETDFSAGAKTNEIKTRQNDIEPVIMPSRGLLAAALRKKMPESF